MGTRVVVPGEEGLFLPAVIQAVKTAPKTDPGQDQTGSSSSGSGVNSTSRYSVRFDLTRKVREYPETDIIGPGFAGITGLKLRPGQIVYVTYCNREMQGSVVVHRPNIDQVIVRLLVSFFFTFLKFSYFEMLTECFREKTTKMKIPNFYPDQLFIYHFLLLLISSIGFLSLL